MKQTVLAVSSAMLLMVLMFFGWFVWPTPWITWHSSIPESPRLEAIEIIWQVNRFSGVVKKTLCGAQFDPYCKVVIIKVEPL